MSRFFSLFCLSLILGSTALAQDKGEHIVLTGSPSLMQWEKYKIQPHDNWWMNFVRASRIRIDQLRQQYGLGLEGLTNLIRDRDAASDDDTLSATGS